MTVVLLEVLDLFPLIPFERIWITKQFISATFRGYLACTIFLDSCFCLQGVCTQRDCYKRLICVGSDHPFTP